MFSCLQYIKRSWRAICLWIYQTMFERLDPEWLGRDFEGWRKGFSFWGRKMVSTEWSPGSPDPSGKILFLFDFNKCYRNYKEFFITRTGTLKLV